MAQHHSQVSISSSCDIVNSSHRRFSVNGGSTVLVDQPDTGGGHVVLSVPVQLTLKSGTNSITIGSGQSSKSVMFFTCPFLTKCPITKAYAADLDKIVVYTAT